MPYQPRACEQRSCEQRSWELQLVLPAWYRVGTTHSNPRPSDPKSDALSAELPAHCHDSRAIELLGGLRADRGGCIPPLRSSWLACRSDPRAAGRRDPSRGGARRARGRRDPAWASSPLRRVHARPPPKVAPLAAAGPVAQRGLARSLAERLDPGRGCIAASGGFPMISTAPGAAAPTRLSGFTRTQADSPTPRPVRFFRPGHGSAAHRRTAVLPCCHLDRRLRPGPPPIDDVPAPRALAAFATSTTLPLRAADASPRHDVLLGRVRR